MFMAASFLSVCAPALCASAPGWLVRFTWARRPADLGEAKPKRFNTSQHHGAVRLRMLDSLGITTKVWWQLMVYKMACAFACMCAAFVCACALRMHNHFQAPNLHSNHPGLGVQSVKRGAAEHVARCRADALTLSGS